MPVLVETNYFGNLKQVDKPLVEIIPVPYEYTTSYIKGTKNGPQAILNASKNIDSFDEELWVDISKVKINTSNFIKCNSVSDENKDPFFEIEKAVKNSIISGSIPILIGGENSISYGGIKTAYELYPDLSILHFDSRPNLKSEINGNKFNHLCSMRQVSEIMPDLKIVQLGIRGISEEEKNWVEEGTNIDIYFAREKENWDISEILSHLTRNVYISFDFSVLDSSVMSATTLPEPGGLNYSETLNILKNVCGFKDIVGMDFVEFSPIEGNKAPDMLAARLIYKTIGYTFAKELGVLDEKEE